MQVEMRPLGNSLAVSLSRELRDQYNITPDTEFAVTVEEDMLIITPHHDPARRAAFLEALEETNRLYSHALQRLAE